MVDYILDTAGQKGTGKWTSVSSLDLGMPVTLIGEAVYARCLSAMKDARVEASKILSGPKAKFEGENTANYANPEYDRRYRQLALLEDGPAKQKLIDEMVDLLRADAPWAFGYFPYSAGAYQQWVGNAKYGLFTTDRALYYKVDAPLRVRRQAEWNPPRYWPLGLMLGGALLLAWIAWRGFHARERKTAAPLRDVAARS